MGKPVRLALVCAAAICMIGLPLHCGAEEPAAPASDWSTFRGDLLRTGTSAGSGPSSANLAWSTPLPLGSESWSSPAVYGSKVYIGNSNGNFYCIDAASGQIDWTYDSGNYPIYSSPTVAYGLVIFGAYREIVALPLADPNGDGTMQLSERAWNFTTGSSSPTGGVNDVNCASPAVAGGRLYMGAVDQYFYCINATQGGTPLWKTWTPFRGQHAFSSSGAISGNCVFAATGNQPGGESSGRLYAFNCTTGAIEWQFDLRDITYSTPAVYSGKVYICNSGDWLVNSGNRTYEMYCLDEDGYLDGSDDGVSDLHFGGSDLIWSYNTTKYVYSSPAVVNGKLFFGCNSGRLTCLDAETGAVAWTLDTTPAPGSQPGGIMGSPAVAGGLVYVGTQDGKLIAVPEDDPDGSGVIDSGEIAWSYEIGGQLVCSPAVAGGKIYIANQYGEVFCLGPGPVHEFGAQWAALGIAAISVTVAAIMRQKELPAL